MERFDAVFQKLRQMVSFLIKRLWEKLIEVVALLIALASLLIAYNQYKVSAQFQDLQYQLQQTEISIIEGQFVSGLLPSLIQGSESEKELTLWILQLKAPQMAEQILKIISQKDPRPQIRKAATEQLQNVQFSRLLKDANMFLQLGRFQSAAEYFHQAAAFVDSSKVNLKLLEVATSRFKAGSDSLAAILFQQALTNSQ